MELVQDTFHSLHLSAEAYTTQEEVTESVIPDALPDACRVVDALASVTIRDRLPREGGAEIRASVHVRVLCAAERVRGGEKLICIETPLTFNHRVDLPGMTPDAELLCDAVPVNAEARLLNPRKLSVRVELRFHTRAYGDAPTEITSGVADDDSMMLLRRSAVIRTAAEISVKNFTVIDEIAIPALDPTELLCHAVELPEAETICAASRITIRGRAAVSVLYNDSEERVGVFACEIPFEQAVESPSVTEDMQGETVLSLKNPEITLAEDADGQRVLAVSIGVCAETVLYEEHEVSVLTDAYSTAFQTELRRESFDYDEPAEPWQQTVGLAEQFELPFPAVRLIDSRLGVLGEADAGNAVFHVLLQAVCEGDDGQLFGISRRIPAVFEAPPCPAESLKCRMENVSVTLQDGLSVRLSLTARSGCSVRKHLDTVSAVEQGEPIRGTDGPALILRFSASESLWKIAGEYHASLQMIRTLNGLTESQESADRETVQGPVLIPLIQ